MKCWEPFAREFVPVVPNCSSRELALSSFLTREVRDVYKRQLRRAAGRLFKRWKPQELLLNGNDIQLRYGGVIPSLRLTEGGEAEIARLDGLSLIHI